MSCVRVPIPAAARRGSPSDARYVHQGKRPTWAGSLIASIVTRRSYLGRRGGGDLSRSRRKRYRLRRSRNQPRQRRVRSARRAALAGVAWRSQRITVKRAEIEGPPVPGASTEVVGKDPAFRWINGWVSEAREVITAFVFSCALFDDHYPRQVVAGKRRG